MTTQTELLTATEKIAAALQQIPVTFNKYTFTNIRGTATRWEALIPDCLTNDLFFSNIPCGYATRKATIAAWQEWVAMASSNDYCSQFLYWGLESNWFEETAA